MTKQQIRSIVREAICAAPQELAAESHTLCAMTETTPEWQRASSVLLYSPMADEPDIVPLMNDALATGKAVYLPIGRSEPVYFEEVRAGARRTVRIEEAGVQLAIVPGRAFTSGGLRLGRGGGYYDRLLPRLHCPKWALALRCQIFDSLPCDEWDVPVDKVITPGG